MSEAPAFTVDPAAVGERIERLLEASAASGPVALERAEELVRLVVELYGAGLERLMEIAYEAGVLDDEVLSALAADELVSGLLLVHGLHPYGLQDRVEQALESVRPYFESHGGDMRLIDVSNEGVVRLALIGSCDGCASSSATLELTVEEAIRAAAPEVVQIEIEPSGGAATPQLSGLISVDQLSARLRAGSPA
jgi:Fe-S cluster biogenesis protein NfuA